MKAGSNDVDFSGYYKKNSVMNKLFRWVDIKKIRILKKLYDDKNLKVLDIGCGTGDITSKIKGCTLYGVDSNPYLLNIAKKNGLTTKKGYFDKLPYNSGYFDVVIAVDVIEHVESREAFMREIKRVLKKNGEFVVFTPNYNSPLWVLAEKFGNAVSQQSSGHISPFIKESLNHILKKNFRSFSDVRSINFTLGLYSKARK